MKFCELDLPLHLGQGILNYKFFADVLYGLPQVQWLFPFAAELFFEGLEQPLLSKLGPCSAPITAITLFFDRRRRQTFPFQVRALHVSLCFYRSNRRPGLAIHHLAERELNRP